MIEGRCDDLVTLYHQNHSNKETQHVMIFPDFIRQSLLHSSHDLEEYIVTHDKVGSLTIALRYKNGECDSAKTQEAITQALTQMAKQQDCKPPSINFIDYPRINSVNLKKLKRIVRTY